jgi:hypothetical protein
VRAPDWVAQGGTPRLRVAVREEARAQLRQLAGGGGDDDAAGRPRFFGGAPEQLEAALVQLLQADPRSVYRKHKCAGQEYRVRLDGLEARCAFADGEDAVDVLAVAAAESETTCMSEEEDG